MHGRGSQASTPMSDTAGRGDAGGTPQTARSCRVVPRGDSRIGPTQADTAEIGADAAKIRPTRSVSVRIGLYRPKRPSQAEIQKKKN